MGLLQSKHDILCNCCCDIKLVIVASKNLEQVLENEFGAVGRGLHEKITSATDLPPKLQRKLRKVATIRNKLIHTVGYDEVEDRERFKKDFHEAVEELEQIVKERGKTGDSNCVIA
mmetsp:Transcript_4824/g.10550  ORF Transcript_4824/g.10550 Transcript_4824/m.10550 type:complete len:116 (-) Transcript_4824:1729-2076(-)